MVRKSDSLMQQNDARVTAQETQDLTHVHVHEVTVEGFEIGARSLSSLVTFTGVYP